MLSSLSINGGLGVESSELLSHSHDLMHAVMEAACCVYTTNLSEAKQPSEMRVVVNSIIGYYEAECCLRE
jgi:hypothetical protein